MMALVDEGKIGVVIAKDMSRIGRNYLEVGMYTEITLLRKWSITQQKAEQRDFTPRCSS